jgi:hypothetical protein
VKSRKFGRALLPQLARKSGLFLLGKPWLSLTKHGAFMV